jgi:hypothetical protein
VLGDTIEAVRALPLDGLSFLAADVTSTAFNRAIRGTARDRRMWRCRPPISRSMPRRFAKLRRVAAVALRGFVKGGARFALAHPRLLHGASRWSGGVPRRHLQRAMEIGGARCRRAAQAMFLPRALSSR